MPCLMDLPTEILYEILLYNTLPYTMRVCKELSILEEKAMVYRHIHIYMKYNNATSAFENGDRDSCILLYKISNIDSYWEDHLSLIYMDDPRLAMKMISIGSMNISYSYILEYITDMYYTYPPLASAILRKTDLSYLELYTIALCCLDSRVLDIVEYIVIMFDMNINHIISDYMKDKNNNYDNDSYRACTISKLIERGIPIDYKMVSSIALSLISKT